MPTRSQQGNDGDDELFASLFEQHKNLVYRTAYLMLNHQQDAEDALQEVFLRVYRHLGAYDPARGAFTTWLHRITVNHCLNRQRRYSPRLLDVEAADGAAGEHLPPSPESLVESDEMLRHLLDDLSEALRPVVVLRYAWDLSYAEIAAILDIPLGTVQSRLHSALKQVRQKVLANGSMQEEVQG